MKDLTLNDLKSFSFIQKVLNHSKVKNLIVYGSRARGDYTEHSDLDLCVVGTEISEADWSDLVFLMESNSETLIPIDSVHYEKIESATLKEAIDKDGLSLLP